MESIFSFLIYRWWRFQAKLIFKKRGGYSAKSSSHNNKIKKVIISSQNQILANIVTRGDTKYIFKNLQMQVCYIKQEDLSFIDNNWEIKSKYLVLYHTPLSGKPIRYFEIIMTYTDNINISNTREVPSNSSSDTYINNLRSCS